MPRRMAAALHAICIMRLCPVPGPFGSTTPKPPISETGEQKHDLAAVGLAVFCARAALRHTLNLHSRSQPGGK